MKGLPVFCLLVIACSGKSSESAIENVPHAALLSHVDPEEKVEVVSPATPLLVTRNMLDRVQVLIPRTFRVMDDEMISLKYPLKQRASFEVHTDEDATVNIAFEHTQNKALPADLPGIRQVFEKQFNQPGIDFQRSELRSINGKDFIVVEMITPAVDTKVYNLLFVTSSDGRLLLGTFNCTVDNLTYWKPLAMQIVSSVRVKD